MKLLPNLCRLTFALALGFATLSFTSCVTPSADEIVSLINSSTTQTFEKDFEKILKYLSRNPADEQKRIAYLNALCRYDEKFGVRGQSLELYSKWIAELSDQSRFSSSVQDYQLTALRTMAWLNDPELNITIRDRCLAGGSKALAAALTGWRMALSARPQYPPQLRQFILELSGEILGSNPQSSNATSARIEEDPERMALALEYLWYPTAEDLYSEINRMVNLRASDPAILRLMRWVDRWKEKETIQLSDNTQQSRSSFVSASPAWPLLISMTQRIAGESVQFPQSSKKARSILAQTACFHLIPVLLKELDDRSLGADGLQRDRGDIQVELGSLALIANALYSAQPEAVRQLVEPGWIYWNQNWFYADPLHFNSIQNLKGVILQAITADLTEVSVVNLDNLLLLSERLDRDYLAQVYQVLSPANTGEAMRLSEEQAVSFVRSIGRWMQGSAARSGQENAMDEVAESMASFLWLPSDQLRGWVAGFLLPDRAEILAVMMESKLDQFLNNPNGESAQQLLGYYLNACKHRSLALAIERAEAQTRDVDTSVWKSGAGFVYHLDLLLRFLQSADIEARRIVAGFLKFRNPDELALALSGFIDGFNINVLEDLLGAVDLKPATREASYKTMASQLASGLSEGNSLWIAKSILESKHPEARLALREFLKSGVPSHLSTRRLIALSDLETP
jgi:hypothetical protein